MRYLLAPAILAALVLAGCGGEVDPARTGPGAAEVRLYENLYNGRFGQAYDALHPAHQKIVSRRLFVACSRRTIAVHKLDSIEILEVFDKTVDLPALGKQRVKAVRVRLTSTTGETQQPFVEHEVRVGPGWRWVLNATAASAYRAGRCP